jgi:hypothetical protein
VDYIGIIVYDGDGYKEMRRCWEENNGREEYERRIEKIRIMRK